MKSGVEAAAVPVEEPADTVLDFDPVGPAEAVELADVDELAHRAVRLGGIELNRAGETSRLRDQFRKFPDCQFLAGADIDVAVADFA